MSITKHSEIEHLLPSLGQKVRYKGDMANQPGEGRVTAINPADRFSGKTVDIRLDDGRTANGLTPSAFHASNGPADWEIIEEK